MTKRTIYLFGILTFIFLVFLGMFFAQFLREQRAEAQSNQASAAYSRYESDPFDKYSFDNVQRMVEAIHAEGHAIPKGHPRIFIHAANREALRQKIAANFAAWMQELVNLADANFGKVITDPGGDSNEPDGQPVVLANALIYQLGLMPGVAYKHTREEYGQEGVRHLLDMASIDTKYVHYVYLGIPLGYDWLYELMTDEQRRTVAAKLLAYAQPANTQILAYNNPPGAELLGPLAVLGDGINDPEAQRLLDLFYSGYVFGDGTLPVDLEPNFTASLIFTPEGPGIEGLVYSARYGPFYPILLAWRDQTGEDYFKLPFLQNWPLHFTHMTGNEYEHQDKYQERGKEAYRQGITNYYGVLPFLEAGLTPSNPDAASLAKYHVRNALKYVSQSHRVVYMLLADPGIQTRSPAELNLQTTAHFEGVNNVFARDFWQGTDTTWLWFQSPTWNARDVGALNDLVIWKNGGMLLPKHTMRHDYDGGNRTNTLVLYDDTQPGKTFIPQNVMDRASNRNIGLRGNYSFRDLNKGLVGYHEGLRYVEDRPGEYLYAFGDGGQQFQETNPLPPSLGGIGPGRLTLPGWSRQLVFFPASSNDSPDYFFVLDRVNTARDTLHPFVPLHFNMRPEIRDHDTNANLGEGNKEVQGIWRYQGADRIVATNTVRTSWGQAHGRLFVDTLLPADPLYYRMGGVVERNIDRFGNLQKVGSGSEDDPVNVLNGMWRVEIGSPQQSDKQIYLQVMQATDASVENPDPTTLLEGQGLIGASVAGNLALFSASETPVVSAAVTVPQNVTGTMNVLLSDLAPEASYTVAFGSLQQNITASKTGTAYFKTVSITPGTNITVIKTGAPPPPPPPPGNRAPTVNAGEDQTITLPASATLDGTVSDDGLPNPPKAVTTTWSKVSGPGTVTFGNAALVDTTASFSLAGTYVLRLTGNDSALSASDDAQMTVSASPPPPSGALCLQVRSDNRRRKGKDHNFSKVKITITDESTNTVSLNQTYVSDREGKVTIPQADLGQVKNDTITLYTLSAKIMGHLRVSDKQQKDLFKNNSCYSLSKEGTLGDLDGNGIVNINDFRKLRLHYPNKDAELNEIYGVRPRAVDFIRIFRAFNKRDE